MKKNLACTTGLGSADWAAMHSRHTMSRCHAKLVTADEHKHTYATFIVTVKSTVSGVQELKGASGPSR